MDFGKYIHELLLENDIVIVPGFGAFVSEYKPAEINDDSGEIKPPSKSISFNQQIRNNDGLLVGHVAEKRRISHFDALKRIEKERENILYKLDSAEKVELDEVGILFYTEENTIGFTAVEDENLLLDSFGLEVTSIDSFEEKEPVVSTTTEQEKPEEPNPEVAAPITTPAEEERKDEPVPIQEPDPKPVSEIEPISTTNSRMDENMPEEKKKKRGWLWLLLILIPLIAVSIFIFMKGYKDGASNKVKETEVKTIEEPTLIPQDTAKVDTTQVLQKDTVEIEMPKPEPELETDSNTPKYYLVGGSFSVEENANTYLNELKEKGFDAFHVGKKGRFFIIGIGTYNTFDEAEKARKEFMANNSGSEVWVYKK